MPDDLNFDTFTGSSRPANPAKKHPNALVLSVNAPSTFSQKKTARPSPHSSRFSSIASIISMYLRVS